MWRKTGQFILANRIPLLVVLILSTLLMGYFASKVQLSYEFSRAIPANHPANKTYQAFKKKYGQDGSLLVIGIQTNDFFHETLFNSYATLVRDLKKVNGVTDIISVPSAINLVKQPETEKLVAATIFQEKNLSQAEIDSAKNIFFKPSFLSRPVI
jgi:predicted RND superfamily exporter protein